MKVILNSRCLELIASAASGRGEEHAAFYFTGGILSAANGFTDDVIHGSAMPESIRKVDLRISFIGLCDYDLGMFSSPSGGKCEWIIPETLKGLFSGAYTARSLESITESLSSGSRIIIDGSVCGSIEVMCEFDGMCGLPYSVQPGRHMQDDRRTLLWLGEKNFEKISGTSVCCIGAGGLINPFVVQAVHHGFRRFILIDGDRLEAHNLNRFVGALPSHEGMFKTDILRDYILGIRPDADVNTFNCMFPEWDSATAMAGAGIIVCGVDNDYARLMVQLYALAFNRAFFDMGSGIFLEDGCAGGPVIDERGGRVKFFSPGGPCLACMGLSPSAAGSSSAGAAGLLRGYIAGTGITPPSVVTLNFAVSSICLNMAVEYITKGLLVDRHVHYDELGRRMFKISEEKKPACPVCGGAVE